MPDERPADDETITDGAIDVFPAAYQFVERNIGLILRRAMWVELWVDRCISAYIADGEDGQALMMTDVLSHLSVDRRLNLLAKILRKIGHDEDASTVRRKIEEALKIRNLLAHSTLFHGPVPEHREGDIPIVSFGRGGHHVRTIRQADVEGALIKLKSAEERLIELCNEFQAADIRIGLKGRATDSGGPLK